jgi:hypothetical protein
MQAKVYDFFRKKSSLVNFFFCCFSCQFFDNIPHEAQDVKIDRVVAIEARPLGVQPMHSAASPAGTALY